MMMPRPEINHAMSIVTAGLGFNLFLDVPSGCRLREIDKLMVTDNLLNSRSYSADNQRGIEAVRCSPEPVLLDDLEKIFLIKISEVELRQTNHFVSPCFHRRLKKSF